jgi:hypothetical protein
VLKKLIYQKNYNIPGWNDVCKQAHWHEEAREAYIMWKNSGKVKQGPIFELLSKSKAVFKSVLRKCKNNQDKHVDDAIARKFILKDSKSFWA